LLAALGEGKFAIRETGETVVAEHAPLIIITTNDERELSRPFVRRCIVAELRQLRGEKLQAWFGAVGRAHFPGHAALIDSIAEFLVALEGAPSAAEFVDLLRACIELGMNKDHPQFDVMRRLVADKARSLASGG
jgi:hypothetical protein